MTRLAAVLAAALALGPAPARAQAPPAAAAKDVVLRALDRELTRAFKRLPAAEKEPLYYLAYELRETRRSDLSAVLGALDSASDRVYRYLDVDARVGDRKLDSTHQFKGSGSWLEESSQSAAEVTVEDDEDSLRADAWLQTDRAYKEALKRYTKVQTNKAVTAEEEDKSDDFSSEEPARHYDRAEPPVFDRVAWGERLRRLSAAFKAHPFVLDSGVWLAVETQNRYLLTSEGTRVVTGNRYVRLGYQLSTRTEDGLDLERYKSYDAEDPAALPSDERILADIATSAAELSALKAGPMVEPYTGPAIIKNRATAVYFHEILGHRLEGHRQKIEEEGQTFKKKLGQAVTAPFISVTDDATLREFRGQFLRGWYRFDDEGMPARRVPLVESGMLKGFLLSRYPVDGFPRSNGHGRRSSGRPVVARMANTMVEASSTVPYPELRKRLIEEVRRQGKPYGLVFEDISGGFTNTGRYGPQSFKVLPLLVYRVYPDGRPDEAVRGVDIVGTPLTAFSKIIAAADDYGVFNGTCGAESGWVPVSGVAPSILVSEMEVEKKAKSSEKPPVLPPPHHDR